jgi:hypothetical protein
MYNDILELSNLYVKASENYFFDTKMRINELVIKELAKKTGLDYLRIMEQILESPIHNKIQELAEEIKLEADKLAS